MIKSVLLAYETGEDNHISIRRCFDIKRNRLINLDATIIDYPEVTSVTLPNLVYKQAKDNDIFVVEWEAHNDPAKLVPISTVTNLNIAEEVYEIIDLSLNGVDIVTTLQNGFYLPYDVRNKFFILTGMQNLTNYVAIFCEKKYFIQDSEGYYYVKEKHNNLPIISFEKYLIQKDDIVYLEKHYTNLDYRRAFYKHTDLIELQKLDKLFIDDGTKFLLNYYKNVLENRKSELKITHKEIQEFHLRLINILKENDDAINYLESLGYPNAVAKDTLEHAEDIIKSAILMNDTNFDLVKRVIMESNEIVEKYKAQIIEEITKQNAEFNKEFEENKRTKTLELEILQKNVDSLKSEAIKLEQQVQESKNEYNVVNEEVSLYFKDLEHKVTDYVLNNTFLSKLINNNTHDSLSFEAESPHYYIEGELTNRTNISYAENVESIASLNLGISSSQKKNFTNTILNVHKLRMNFLVDSYHSEEFSNYLASIFGKRSLGILYVDDNESISSLSNCIKNDDQVILVKNSLKLIDTKYVDFLISKNDKVTFVFEIEDGSNLRYLPSHIWKKVFYLYYANEVSEFSRSKDINYYNLDFNMPELDNKSNIDVFVDNTNIDIDDKTFVKHNYVDVKNAVKKFNVVGSDNKLNSFCVPHLLLLFNSIGVDISNRKIQNEDLSEYLSSIFSK